MNTIPIFYWHELNQEQKDDLINRAQSGEEIEMKAPDWCDEPDAVSFLGCWALYFGYVKEENRCKNCDSYKPNVEKDNQNGKQTKSN